MAHSHIFITQTHIERQRFERIVAKLFFEIGSLHTFSDSAESLTFEPWDEYLVSKRIISLSFDNKDDLRDIIPSLYEVRTQPTLVFLGDLSEYSLALQEGMLQLLEEPPKHVTLVLTSSSRQNILPTILSRSQIHQVPQSLIISLLDTHMLERVKHTLPEVKKTIQKLFVARDSLQIPDLKKVERYEIDFWLWQLGVYGEQVFLKNSSLTVAQLLLKIAEARTLNMQNVQKKLVLSWVFESNIVERI